MEFSERLELRDQSIDTLSEFLKELPEVDSMIVIGDENTDSLTLNAAVVIGSEDDMRTVYGRINYYVSNELGLESKKVQRREDSFYLVEYKLESGITITVFICTVSELFPTPWWRCIFDNTGKAAAAMPADAKVEQDVLCDEPKPEPEPEPEPEPAPEPEPEPAPEPVLEVVPDPNEPPAPAEQEEEDEDEKYWTFVSNSIRTAKHAIASGAYIRATETINTLRKMLIELICTRNGITENFERAIDFVDCEEKNELIKTYPNGTDKTSLINALAVETDLFDRLA